MMAYDPQMGSEILSKADRIIARWRTLYLKSGSYDREEISDMARQRPFVVSERNDFHVKGERCYICDRLFQKKEAEEGINKGYLIVHI